MSDEVNLLEISQPDERAHRRRTQGQSEQNRPSVNTSSVGPSTMDHQAVVATTPNLASTIILERANRPINNMANPMSTVRHNVF